MPGLSEIAENPTSQKREHLAHVRELDGIRGIAAIVVFFHHLLYVSIPNPGQWNVPVYLLARLSYAGAYGVDLFFVLSGFLITSILLLDRADPNYYWNFYWKRALRIFPLYLVALVCLAVLVPGMMKYVVISALFLANFAQLFHITADGPFWTLAIEEQFYLIWPQFARRLTAEKLQRMALGLVIAEPVLRLIAAAFGHHNYRFTFLHCDGLGLGALLACQQYHATSDAGRAERPNRRSHGWVLLLVGTALTALPLMLPDAGRIAQAGGALQLTGISLLCFSAVRFAVRNSGRRMLAVLRSRVLVFFGLISYCMYMSHIYVMRAYDHWRGALQVGDMTAYTARFFAVLAATIVVCLISRYALELPMMSLRKYVLRKNPVR